MKGHRKGQAAIVRTDVRSPRAELSVERTSFAAGSRKGQAAMEYLMTYGWAILVIVVVLAILAFYLPRLIQVPDSCLFSQPGFSCENQILSADTANNVILRFNLLNQQGQTINITRVKCTMEPTGSITKPTEIVSEAVVSGGKKSFQITSCYDANGGALTMSPGSSFKGSIVVWYNFQNDVEGAPERMAIATVTGTLVPE